MGTSTVSGPFRSQNGFQEWNGTAWVPVAGGGGGGGVTYIQLVGDYPSVYGDTDNRYSTNPNNDPPTGPTAGTFVQMPQMAVGESCAFCGNGGSQNDVWAIKLPTVAGADVTAFYGNSWGVSVIGGDFPSYTLTTYWPISDSSGPNDTFFVYGIYAETSSFLTITRIPDAVIPGFGVAALFKVTGIPITYSFPIADSFVYPYSQLIPAP
jgi:hypothetical protein